MADFFIKDFSGGMATNVSSTLMPKNCCELLLNLVVDEEIGAATSRLGTAIVGSQLVDDSNPILGLHQHIDTANSSNNKLFATVNASGDATSVIYDVVAGTTSVTGLTASAKMRFLTFLGATLAINGADAERSYTSSGWITTGGAFDLANIPSSNTINLAEEFLDRVYLAGDNSEPTRLYYSSVPVSGAVSWTSGNGFVDIEAEDGGGPITALSKVPGYLLIFKERSIHRWNFESAFPETMIQIGTPSQESVVKGAGLCAFYSNSNENAKGFYVTNGGRPEPISHDVNRPIKKWVDAIPSSYDANVSGFATDRGFAWSVGDLTVDGVDYVNVVLSWNRILNQWSVFSYPSEFRVFAHYLVSGVNTIVGGDDDGTVFRVNKAATYSDNGTAIDWRLITQHDTFGINNLKSLKDKVYIRGKNLEGISSYGIIDENVSDKVPLQEGGFLTRVLSYFGIDREVKGTSIALEINGSTLNNRAYIREIEADVTANDTYGET